MTPQHSEDFAKSGLVWVYARAQQEIRDTRLAWGTNDIAIFARALGESTDSVHLFGRARADVLKAFREVAPELTRVIARLSEVLPLDRVHLVIMHTHTYVMDVYIPKHDAGVLN